MRKATEDIILDELFNLSHKIDKMVTKEEFEKRNQELYEDMKKFATKEDLKKFATKEDLKKFATKEDLKKFATKEDLKKGFDEQAVEIAEIFHNTFETLEKREKKFLEENYKKIV